jgi:hypothetical protein
MSAPTLAPPARSDSSATPAATPPATTVYTHDSGGPRLRQCKRCGAPMPPDAPRQRRFCDQCRSAARAETFVVQAQLAAESLADDYLDGLLETARGYLAVHRPWVLDGRGKGRR